MHLIISIVVAILVAWAFRRRSRTDPLGLWRVAACVVAAALPHVDKAFYWVSPALGLGYQFTFMWSALLAPLFAFAIAQGFSWLSGGKLPESKRTWQRFFVPVMATMAFNLLLAVLSENGVALLAPLWFGRFSFSIVHSFDVGLLVGLVVFALLALSIGSFRTDAGRITLALLIVYVGVVGTFKLKAYNVGERYAAGMDLQVEKIYTLPQPLSPFYWRVVVLTKDNRLHDTRISLKRDNIVPIKADMNTVEKTKASYMPVHGAVWRIYNRFGLDNPAFLEKAWQSQISQSLGWASRFAVYQKMRTYKGMQCAQLKDLRFEGSRSAHLGTYLLCRGKDSWRAYQAADDASFLQLDVIY